LDQILLTIERPAVCHAAKIPGGVQLIGPVYSPGGERLTVVLGTGQGRWFVRTMFPLSQKDYVRAVRSGRPSPWPPK
jgi:hypothetical protein